MAANGIQLRQLRQAVHCSSMDATKTMVQAFITSRLDSCNVLYYGISDELMRRLQSTGNLDSPTDNLGGH